VAEFAEGNEGYAFLNEWMFWVFETLPMILAFGIFCIRHPSQWLSHTLSEKLVKKRKRNAPHDEELEEGPFQEA
jgi:hypothetical protein